MIFHRISRGAVNKLAWIDETEGGKGQECGEIVSLQSYYRAAESGLLFHGSFCSLHFCKLFTAGPAF